jgi:hypothetical protein
MPTHKTFTAEDEYFIELVTTMGRQLNHDYEPVLAQIESRCARADEAKTKGDHWEAFVHAFLMCVYDTVYYLREVPVCALAQLHMPKLDKGIDFVCHHNSVGWIAVQAKYRYRTSLPWHQSSTFWGLARNTGPWSNVVLVTNCDQASPPGLMNKGDLVMNRDALIRELGRMDWGSLYRGTSSAPLLGHNQQLPTLVLKEEPTTSVPLTLMYPVASPSQYIRPPTITIRPQVQPMDIDPPAPVVVPIPLAPPPVIIPTSTKKVIRRRLPLTVEDKARAQALINTIIEWHRVYGERTGFHLDWVEDVAQQMAHEPTVKPTRKQLTSLLKAVTKWHMVQDLAAATGVRS